MALSEVGKIQTATLSEEGLLKCKTLSHMCDCDSLSQGGWVESPHRGRVVELTDLAQQKIDLTESI